MSLCYVNIRMRGAIGPSLLQVYVDFSMDKWYFVEELKVVEEEEEEKKNSKIVLL